MRWSTTVPLFLTGLKGRSDRIVRRSPHLARIPSTSRRIRSSVTWSRPITSHEFTTTPMPQPRSIGRSRGGPVQRRQEGAAHDPQDGPGGQPGDGSEADDARNGPARRRRRRTEEDHHHGRGPGERAHPDPPAGTADAAAQDQRLGGAQHRAHPRAECGSPGQHEHGRWLPAVAGGEHAGRGHRRPPQPRDQRGHGHPAAPVRLGQPRPQPERLRRPQRHALVQATRDHQRQRRTPSDTRHGGHLGRPCGSLHADRLGRPAEPDPTGERWRRRVGL